jgi:predicted RNA-binding protein with PUA-like domain
MTTSYQSNVLDTSYNGWENYETWNVALWLQNDEGLYHLAREAGDYKTFADVMTEFYSDEAQTPDGVRYNDPRVNVIQINSDVFDF